MAEVATYELIETIRVKDTGYSPRTDAPLIEKFQRVFGTDVGSVIDEVAGISPLQQ